MRIPSPRRLGAGLRSALCGLTVLGAAATSAQPRFDFDATPGDLPKTVRPIHYGLRLTLDPARSDFDGEVDIQLDVRRAVDTLRLHARRLQPLALSLHQAGRRRDLQLSADAASQQWRLTPTDGAPVPPGRHRLSIRYRGQVNDSGVGLYRAGHALNGQPQAMLATQLQAIDARSLFPAFDEPAFRAVFALTVRAPRGLAVFANQPAERVHTDGADRVHRFRPTPPMPSYLFAVTVGRYDLLAGSSQGVPLRILTAPGKRAEAAYAMRVTREVLPWFGRYFGTPYALPKLDQLAVPSVRSGAMEDWGLISYSEDSLLFTPGRSSPATQRGVYNTIAHEIAHQWFGNLVTAASWDELWLNEAFATWLADKATARFNPAWQTALAQRLPLDRTMLGDTSEATRAIRSGPVAEGAVGDVFDSITYTKGGAVLGMLEQWIGEAGFRRGLAAYMRERRLSSATAGDLWHHLGQASGRDVAAVAASWTDRPGFPLIEVSSRCTGPAAAPVTQVSLRQRRLRTEAAAPSDADDAPWQIPLRLARGPQRRVLLFGSRELTLTLPGCTDAPVIANAGGIAYVRVRPDPALAAALVRHFPRLDGADQVTVLSDALALAQAGELSLAHWLALTARMAQVHGPARTTLFELASSGFAFLDEAFAGTATQPPLRAAARRLLAPELARLGWDEHPGDTPQVRQWRGGLIGQLARVDDPATVARALAAFDDDESGRRRLPASIRTQVLQAAGTHADRTRFDRLMARFKAADGEEERWALATALASGRDAERAAELLAASLTGITPPNVAIELPRLVSEHSPFNSLAYSFTLRHWEALATLAGDALYARHWLLPGVAATFNDAAQAPRLMADQQQKDGSDGERPAARMAARIRLLATVREREATALDVPLRSP